jgi:hypothetical protein
MLHGERGNMDIIRRIPKTQKVMKKRNKISDDKIHTVLFTKGMRYFLMI